MVSTQNKIIYEVENYYSKKIKEHGANSLGVDWKSEESQLLRFQQLMKIVQSNEVFSIIDVGCGYGALINYLFENYTDFDYVGLDISKEMIDCAKNKYGNNKNIQFHVSTISPVNADFSVASGIFNVRLEHENDEWWSYLTNTLDKLNDTSNKGFSFNCLTKYSDSDKMRDYLYYADPCKLFDWCKRKYSKNIAILHDYGLYEFTILVRK